MGNISDFVVTNYWKTKPHVTAGLVDIWVGGRYNFDIMHDVEIPLAEHVVKVHNEWWDKTVWDSYKPNLAYSSYLDTMTWHDYDDGYEAP